MDGTVSGSVERVPSGYERIRAGPAEAVVWSPAAPLLSEVLAHGRTVHDWAGSLPGSEALHGRGIVHAVHAPLPGPDGRERWAVRHYRRGGAVASLLHDRYLRVGPIRPLGELRASETARARGVPTPAVVAGAWYRSGPCYRADLVTELVSDGVTLARRLFEAQASSAEREAALGASGRLVTLLGEAGIRHADLNATNVLLSGRDPHAPSVWVVDLDRATVTDRPSASASSAMLARLERSLSKLGAASGRPLIRAEWAALRAGSRAGRGAPGSDDRPRGTPAGEARD